MKYNKINHSPIVGAMDLKKAGKKYAENKSNLYLQFRVQPNI